LSINDELEKQKDRDLKIFEITRNSSVLYNIKEYSRNKDKNAFNS
jgi:hypothetical protein